MSHRLRILVPEELELKIRKAAQRSRVSTGQWVRRAIEDALRFARHEDSADPVARLASLNGPTSDIDQMLAEIDAGAFMRL